MKKIDVAMLCGLVAFPLTACDGFCVLTKGAPNTTYTWSYTNNETTSSGEFTTYQYGALPSTCRMAPTAVRWM
jgi:hypothetical protein